MCWVLMCDLSIPVPRRQNSILAMPAGCPFYAVTGASWESTRAFLVVWGGQRVDNSQTSLKLNQKRSTLLDCCNIYLVHRSM